MTARPAGEGDAEEDGGLRVTLLGPFTIKLAQTTAGPWSRPPAKQICELVMLSPDRRLGRETARDTLFADLPPVASARALSKALSLARQALSALGTAGHGLLRADRAHIWVSDETPVEVDVVAHEAALRSALSLGPGSDRDAALSTALLEEGVLLADEPYADWALRPREALELLRQRARLELARDRARGWGRSQPDAVVEAWEACLAQDPASEEAASALVKLYSAAGRPHLVSSTYERCRAALAAIGLATSPALDEGYCGRALPTHQSGLTVAQAARQPRNDERRIVTMLFADLSGVSGLDSHDPEDVRNAISSALAAMIAEVEGLGGTVTSVSGAGLAALFGAPEAHEDDPERAVRAGFRVLSVVGGQRPALANELSVRVGVETGPAVVGPLWRADGTGYGAAGQVVEAAALLQSAAMAGSVLVGPVTKRATEDLFDWGGTDKVSLYAKAKPVEATCVERPKAHRAGLLRGPALAGRVPLVGRQTEVLALEGALREATSGTGSVVFVVGEPGLGKTRLVQECRKRYMAWVGAGTGRLPLWLEGRCASYASSTPYGLYQQLLSAWTGVALEEPEEVVRRALERVMRLIFDGDVDHCAFVAHMMGLRGGPAELGVARLSPEGLQRATFASVGAVVGRLVAKGPTVLVLEDLHWADPTSVRLTEEIALLTRGSPLLLICTRRPEPDPGVSGLERALESGSTCTFRRVELAPLDDDSELELAASLVGGNASNEVVAAVRTNVDGIPLFLEERFSSLVEMGTLVKRDNSWALSHTFAHEVPQALERLIRSRVDRLPPTSRDVIVAASVLGPEFSLASLSAVSDAGEHLAEALHHLCGSGLLNEVGRAPEASYRFRHALIQEATYSGLLRGRRRQLHARAAWGLETASAGRPEEAAAVLGHHYAMADEPDRAVHYLEMAGRHAASHFAVDEAVSSFSEAIELVDQGDATLNTSRKAVELRASLAEILWRSSRRDDAREILHEALDRVGPEEKLQAAQLLVRMGRAEVEDCRYDAAVGAFDAAAELLGDNPESQNNEWVDLWLELMVDGRAYLHNRRGQQSDVAAVLSKARPFVEARGAPSRRSGFFCQLALLRCHESRYKIDDEIIALCRSGVQAAENGADEHDVAGVVAQLGAFLLWRGDLEEAQQTLEQALAIAQRIVDPERESTCLCCLSALAIQRHDVEAVRSLSGQALAAAVEGHWSMWTAWATALMAWVAWKDGRVDDAVRLANESAELADDIVSPIPFKSLSLWLLMSVRLASGQVAPAIDIACQLTEPRQAALPGEICSVLEAATAAWARHDSARSARKLTEALELAGRFGYL